MFFMCRSLKQLRARKEKFVDKLNNSEGISSVMLTSMLHGSGLCAVTGVENKYIYLQ